MRIFARIKEEQIALEVLKTERIIAVKRKIQEKTGVVPAEQKLIFESRVLAGDDTVGGCGLQDDNVISVVTTPRTVRIFARKIGGEPMEFEVSKSERIVAVKQRIGEKIGVVPAEHVYSCQAGDLEDDKTVGDYLMAEDSVITVVPIVRRVSVRTFDNKELEYEVMLGDRISDVKRKIEARIGVPPESQTLLHGGKMLADRKSVGECGIAEKDVVQMVAQLREMKISARTMNRRSVELKVANNYLIKDVKAEIQRMIALPAADQKLYFKGRTLEDAETVWECEIADGNVIDAMSELRGGRLGGREDRGPQDAPSLGCRYFVCRQNRLVLFPEAPLP